MASGSYAGSGWPLVSGNNGNARVVGINPNAGQPAIFCS